MLCTSNILNNEGQSALKQGSDSSSYVIMVRAINTAWTGMFPTADSEKSSKLSEQLPSSPPVKEKQSLVYLHLCQGGDLRQRLSWSSAPSSLRSDSGLASSGPESRKGRHGRRRGNHLQRGKGRNGLGGEEEEKKQGGQDGDKRRWRRRTRAWSKKGGKVWDTWKLLEHQQQFGHETSPSEVWLKFINPTSNTFKLILTDKDVLWKL